MPALEDDGGERLREWVIAICMALLCAVAIWTVFGGDLGQLLAGQPPEGAPPVRTFSPKAASEVNGQKGSK